MRANEYKTGCQIPLTIDPLIQSHFRCTLPTPVLLIGLSSLYDPAIKW